MKALRDAALAVLVGTFLGAVLVFAIAGVVTTLTPDKLPACSTEDSHNCYWDARVHGNSEGRSFIDYQGHTYYVEK